MAPYDDSDSSGGEDNELTETNVLLGYASTDANGEEISRLGGYPEWLNPTKAPSAALAKCKVCKDLLVLLLQLNAELPDRFPGHERRIYVFACKRKSCRRQEGSIRAVRGLRTSPEAAALVAAKEAKEARPVKEVPVIPKASDLGLGQALFGGKPAVTATGAPIRANPFSGSSGTSAAANPFAPKSTPSANLFAKPAPPPAPEPKKADPAPDPVPSLTKSFAETLSLNNPQASQSPVPPPEPWPATADQPEAYPVRWLSDAEYEMIDPSPQPLPPANVQIDTSEGPAPGGGKEDKEVFESVMDNVFQKFADRVGENPDQCIRYEFAGQPLLYSKGDKVGLLLHVNSEAGAKVTTTGAKGLPRCGNCGAGRVFEVQLTPRTIEELEIDEDGLDGMDWGTVIVGVCERDCQERGVEVGEAGYLEEWAGVQWEELTVKR
ncbi:programmed cell death protein 2 [Lasiosphaeris hirsuta]|uniref:Programmed cell death protein 2 n=1 Tax=Lasiosphaeris hirsuta TaxID=260670 RepID=A0AA40B8P8_9PEZI|nr:programmed cell death protein 2 [Lasiosphaeris hirsuta]